MLNFSFTTRPHINISAVGGRGRAFERVHWRTESLADAKIDRGFELSARTNGRMFDNRRRPLCPSAPNAPNGPLQINYVARACSVVHFTFLSTRIVRLAAYHFPSSSAINLWAFTLYFHFVQDQWTFLCAIPSFCVFRRLGDEASAFMLLLHFPSGALICHSPFSGPAHHAEHIRLHFVLANRETGPDSYRETPTHEINK